SSLYADRGKPDTPDSPDTRSRDGSRRGGWAVSRYGALAAGAGRRPCDLGSRPHGLPGAGLRCRGTAGTVADVLFSGPKGRSGGGFAGAGQRARSGAPDVGLAGVGNEELESASGLHRAPAARRASAVADRFPIEPPLESAVRMPARGS